MIRNNFNLLFFTQKSYSIRLCSSVSFTAPHKLDIELTQGCKISYYDDIYYLIDISDNLGIMGTVPETDIATFEIAIDLFFLERSSNPKKYLNLPDRDFLKPTPSLDCDLLNQ